MSKHIYCPSSSGPSVSALADPAVEKKVNALPFPGELTFRQRNTREGASLYSLFPGMGVQ